MTFLIITIGVPGVGKTTFCSALSAVIQARIKICPYLIQRDQARARILNRGNIGISKEIDKETSLLCLNALSYGIHTKERVILYDGCNCDKNSVAQIIEKAEQLAFQYRHPVEICLVLVGDHTSNCFHETKDIPVGDYSGYCKGDKMQVIAEHESIPIKVLEKKRSQRVELENELKTYSNRCIIHVHPEINDIKTKKALETRSIFELLCFIARHCDVTIL